MANTPNPNIINESDFFASLDAGEIQEVINKPPIVAGAPEAPPSLPPQTIPTLQGSLPLGMQLPTDLIRTQTPGVPSVRLFPVAPAGTAGTNSAVTSGTRGISNTANQANKTATSANTTAKGASAAVTVVSSTPVMQVDSGGSVVQAPVGSIGSGGGILTPTLDNLRDGLTYGRTRQIALTGGSVDLSKSGVLMKGSLPPMYSGAFTYTATTTSITISWNNLIIYRADGTLTNAGSDSQAITGLTAGITYNFLPYWDEALATLAFVESSGLSNPLVIITGAQFTQGVSPGYVSTTTNLTRPSSLSIEGWFHSNSGGEVDFFRFNSNQTGTHIGGTTDFLLSMGDITAGKVSWGPGTAVITSPASYDDDQWHYVVATYDGTTAILYVDGTQVATGAVTADGSFTGWWRLATYLNTAVSGILAHCAVYSGVILTAAQVLTHFNTMLVSGVSTYETLVANDGATAYWRLVETSGTVAADSVGSNTGTYQNPTSIALNQSQQADASQGTPPIAWSGVPIQATQTAVLQGRVSLGVLTASTPATGTGGGVGGGASGSGGGDKKVSG